MPVMVYHQCFLGIDCYSSLQKLFAEVFFDFGALQTWSTWVATYGYYIDDFALSISKVDLSPLFFSVKKKDISCPWVQGTRFTDRWIVILPFIF